MAPVVPSEKKPESQRPLHPRILVVDDEPNLVELIGDVVGREMGCKIVCASTIAAARKVLATEGIELMVADVNLPDGNGMTLLQDLQKFQPAAAALVITGAPSMDGAITAIRAGAVDFVPKPFTGTQLVQRVRQALDRQALVARQERRIEKLRVAVRKLNEARRLIGKKVDLLCNDLVGAYGELSRQLDGVRNQESFRKCVEQSNDLEQLLCHGMDWLLREVGYSNIAVWLATEDGDAQLGAYMKYTTAGEPVVTDAVKRVVLPLAARDGCVHLQPDEVEAKFSPAERKLLKGQEFLAVNCTYLGDTLAALVFFRDARSPFTEEDEAILKAVSPIFAVSLATVVRGAEGDGDEGDEDGDTDGDRGDDGGDDNSGDPAAGPFLEDGTIDAGDSALEDDAPRAPRPERKPKSGPKSKPKIDPADWWKRGEAPPF